MTAFLIILICMLLAGSAFFSSSETALFSINVTTLKGWAETGTPAQQRVAHLMKDYHRTISTILLGNSFVNILTAVVLNALLTQSQLPVRHRLILATLLNTGLLLCIGEVTPKALAFNAAPTWAPIIARPILLLARLFYPIVAFLKKASGLILNILGTSTRSNAISVEEYQTFTRLANRMEVFSMNEVDMFDRVFALRETQVAQFMVPRLDVKHVDRKLSYADLEMAVHQHCHRFLPVIDSDLDKLVGVLDVVALAFLEREEDMANWVECCVYPPMYVPENGRSQAVLAELRKSGQSLAFVVNEFGGIEGIITVEDVYEQMVGELTDEFDPPEWTTTRVRDGLWRVNGMMPLAQLEAELQITLPAHDSSTPGGLLAEKLDRLPQAGDCWQYKNIRFSASRVHHKRVMEVELERFPETDGVES